jgi:hypothetical protein
MTGWYQQYLDGIDLKKIPALLQQFGINDLSTYEWLFENAALCRLSFASLILSSEKGRLFHAPQGAIISQTQFGMVKGRPKTARWAYWLGYLVRRDLIIQGKQPTSEFLSKLIGILLSRHIPAVEVRTILGDLRKEAEKHATEAAQGLLKNALQQELSDNQYIDQVKTDIEKTLSPKAQYWPAIENGKVREGWLEDVRQIRGSILARVKKYGPLAGEGPLISVERATKLIEGMPLGSLVGHSPIESGTIHMGKSQSMPIPPPMLEQIGDVSLSQTKHAEGGGTTSLKFPTRALDINQPYAAAIQALPHWWSEWLHVQVF